jgi:phage terminase large subunit
MAALSPEVYKQLAGRLPVWKEHPSVMVRELFDVEPDKWQEEALEAFPGAPSMAMKACAGPGKTAMLAWLGWNFMVTRPKPKIGATSINGANLKAGLWSELARWRDKSPLLKHVFEMTNTEITSREFPREWRIEARTWAKDADAAQIGNALRGLHGDYVMWLVDESGDFPDSILPVFENIFSGSPIEAHIVQAGNPTRLSGPLYRACVTARKLWRVIDITGDPDDPNRSPRISLEHARQQIAQYGRDNPWVQVNILGQFPDASLDALIGIEEVQRAMDMKYQQSHIDNMPRLLGVDVAREGLDSSVIFPRQGLVAFKPTVLRNVNSVQGAGQVARMWDQWKVDATFVDNTGGYGAGWIDQLRVLNREAIGIGFAERAVDVRYFNRRAEMYFNLRNWIRGGGALPYDTDILEALPQITTTPRGGKMILEPKDIIKQRVGAAVSPSAFDKLDSLALTFAEPVAARARVPLAGRRESRDSQADLYETYIG